MPCREAALCIIYIMIRDAHIMEDWARFDSTPPSHCSPF